MTQPPPTAESIELPPTALCHEWTTLPAGSEQVSARIAQVLGIEDVFTFAADPRSAADVFPGSRVHVSRLGRTALARSHWQVMLPVMPSAWRRLDLSAFDLVVTSSHACSNAIRVKPGSYRLSYCHTPMRYAWEWRSELGRFPAPVRPFWPLAAAALRRADRGWSREVTLFLANSENTRRRIRRAYGRSSAVLYPPIDTGFWTPDGTERDDFFLFAGRLAPYKRPDIAIDAAAAAGVRLVVAGSGPELEQLRRRGAGVEFVEAPSRATLRDLYRRARALVFPGVEDFGMTMVEAQACGTPVIAFNRGGAREAVNPGVTGVLYDDPSQSALARVLGRFDPSPFSHRALRDHVARFDQGRFDAGILQVVRALLHTPIEIARTEGFAEGLHEELRTRDR